MSRPSEVFARRFAQRYTVDSSTGCWEWAGARLKNGYGRFDVARRTELAHRVAYAIHRGPIPAGMNVCHHCDNRGCVNPGHLFLGSQSDNLMDASRKGRLPTEHAGRAAWRRGRTQYAVVVDGQGLNVTECGNCGGEARYRPSSPSKSGLRFCGLSCRTAHFNRVRSHAA